jgi:hypothetical protein
MAVRQLIESGHRYGWREAAAKYGHKSLSRAGLVRLLNVLRLDRAGPAAAATAASRGLEVRQLSPAELDLHAEDERLDLEHAFIRRAADNGSVCLGVFVDGALAGYTWYGRQNLDLYPRLQISVRGDVVYLYKALTLPAYRGRHCLTENVHHALAAPVLLGATSLVCLVEGANITSFRAFTKIGFRRVGWVCIVGRKPLQWCYCSRGARQDTGLQITATTSANG